MSEDKQLILAANGEIYNHRDCVSNLKENITFKLKVTAEVILALYKKKDLIYRRNERYFWFCHL
jgi:asparagine synthase (glutamine-hydrolysing)